MPKCPDWLTLAVTGGTARTGRLRLQAAVLVAAVAPVVGVLPTSPGSTAAAVPPPPAGWTTTFSDNFSGPAGSGVDRNWTVDQGTAYHGSGCAADFGTGETDTSTSSPANVAEDGHGHLDITPVDSGGSWTSARIETTADSFTAPPGGELEVTASLRQPAPASGLGYWPAFWMVGAGFRASGAGTSGTMNCTSWPSVGEIDIMEDVNAESEVAGTLHCGTDPAGPCNEPTGQSSGLVSCPGCQSGYHTYSVIINRTDPGDESMTWYLDGKAYHTVTESQLGTYAWQAAVDHGFFLILDVAIGGSFPDGVCSCTSPTAATSSGAAMSVGYVAVYQTAPTPDQIVPTPGQTAPAPGQTPATPFPSAGGVSSRGPGATHTDSDA